MKADDDTQSVGKNDDRSIQPLEPIDASRLQDLMSFHLASATAAMARDFSRAVAKIGLTQKQFIVLELIHHNGGASQIDIATILRMDRATTMVLINRLQGRKLIYRSPSPFDSRRQQLFLTETGLETLEEIHAIVASHEDRILNSFSEQEQRDFLCFLRRIYYKED